MSKPTPLIQEIRNRFDHFGETIGNRAQTSSIKIASNQHGYAVTAYPEETYGFEGFTVDVNTPQGIFGERGPTRVEMSREADGVMRLNFGNVTTGDNRITIANATVEPRAACENLMLPGDPGFGLFNKLHAELAERRVVVADALGTIGINVDPTTLTYVSQTTSGGHYDHDNHIATHERRTLLEVSGVDTAIADRVYAHIKLDGSLTAPILPNQRPVEFPPADPMVFRAGKAEANWDMTFRHERPPVGDEALLAFAGLHASFAALYR